MITKFYGYVDTKSKEIRVRSGFRVPMEGPMEKRLYNDIVEQYKLSLSFMQFPYLEERIVRRERLAMPFPSSDILYHMNEIGSRNLSSLNIRVTLGDSSEAQIERLDFRADLGEMELTLDHTIHSEIDFVETDRVEKAYERLIEALYNISIELDAAFRLFNKHMDDSPISDIVSKLGIKIKNSKSYIWRFMMYTYLNILNGEMDNIDEFFSRYNLSPEPTTDEVAKLLSKLIYFDDKRGICINADVSTNTEEVIKGNSVCDFSDTKKFDIFEEIGMPRWPLL